jgi:predicted RNA-binding Zn-ribbon protein involved in translation (DUF1610 family)
LPAVCLGFRLPARKVGITKDMLFFIAGINPRSKPLGGSRCACPACGRTADLQVHKNYSVFTFFFIPVIPFSVSYLAICPNCASVMKLSKEKGKAFEQDHGSVIYNGDLRIMQNNEINACPSCGTKIITNQNFCYHCGAKL